MKISRNKLFESWQMNHLPKKEKLQTIEMGSVIPKIIHQTFYTKELPSEISLNIEKIKALNSDWTYCLYDNEDIESYIKKYFPDVLDSYLKINPKYGAARADLFRYLVIYKEGGVYFDIKSSFTKPFNSSIKISDKMILSHWNYKKWGMHGDIDNPKGEFQQCFIIAVPGHPFLKSVIENILRNIDIYNSFIHFSGQGGVLRLTGPIAYTLAISPLLYKYPYRLVQSKEDLGFVYSIYDGMSHEGLFKIHYSKLKEPIIIE